MRKELWVPGLPKAQARPRLGKAGNVYLPDDGGWRAAIIAAWVEKFGVEPFPREQAVSVRLQFILHRPAGVNIIIEAVEGLRPTKPDLDNLVKPILDSLSGRASGWSGGPVAWHDDAQVVKLVAEKVR